MQMIQSCIRNIYVLQIIQIFIRQFNGTHVCLNANQPNLPLNVVDVENHHLFRSMHRTPSEWSATVENWLKSMVRIFRLSNYKRPHDESLMSDYWLIPTYRRFRYTSTNDYAKHIFPILFHLRDSNRYIFASLKYLLALKRSPFDFFALATFHCNTMQHNIILMKIKSV